MASSGTYLNLTLPDVGVTLGPTWATDLNTALTRVDEHDHSSIGRNLGVSALTIDGDLDFSPGTSDYATTNKKYSGFVNNASTLAATSSSLSDRQCPSYRVVSPADICADRSSSSLSRVQKQRKA